MWGEVKGSGVMVDTGWERDKGYSRRTKGGNGVVGNVTEIYYIPV